MTPSGHIEEIYKLLKALEDRVDKLEYKLDRRKNGKH